ncbi:hypothetical protein, partial [Synechococcus sp. Cruz CV12-2-Slac-r]|uniref:hypothetical protein n=1 Tax=Synechococcus sp. Cruz CV12-2-Slac-r TaxID=2823748 RepID=UPI0020CD3C8C
MTSADLKDLVPAHAQEQLEWVTPKISLLETGDTDGSGKPKNLLEFFSKQVPPDRLYLKPLHT